MWKIEIFQVIIWQSYDLRRHKMEANTLWYYNTACLLYIYSRKSWTAQMYVQCGQHSVCLTKQRPQLPPIMLNCGAVYLEHEICSLDFTDRTLTVFGFPSIIVCIKNLSPRETSPSWRQSQKESSQNGVMRLVKKKKLDSRKGRFAFIFKIEMDLKDRKIFLL